MGVCFSSTKKREKGVEERQEAPIPATNGGGGATFTAADEVPSKHHHHHLLRSFLHRLTTEGSLEHLIRHPHSHPFEPAEGFGLNGCFETVSLAGRGGSGQTWLCKDKVHGGKKVAVKLQQRPISDVLATMAYNEIIFQGTLSEGCIFLTPIFETILTPTHVAQIMEFEGGGNMAEFVAARVPKTARTDLVLSEDEARYFFRQLVAGVSYMHSRNTAHRDIKLDNCLLDYPESTANGGDGMQQAQTQSQLPSSTSTLPLSSQKKELPILKLADFQFVYSCTHLPPVTPSLLGTPVYMAPELLETRFKRSENRHKYDPMQADVWACGIWLVAVLIGAFPFDYEPGSDNETAERHILEEQDAMLWRESLFVKPYLRKMSPALLDIINKMLEPDPQKRITMAGVKIHPWLTTPLQPEYEAKWRRLQQEQTERKQQVAALPLDQTAFEERNKAVWQMVTEAEELPGEKKKHHHQRPHLFHHQHDKDEAQNGNRSNSVGQIEEIIKMDPESRRFVDVNSIPDGYRIDMRLRAVSR